MDIIFSESFWKIEYFNNALWEYLVFLLIFLGLSFGFFLFKYIFYRKISAIIKEKKVFSLLLSILDKIRSPFYIFVSFYIALSSIVVPDILYRLFFLIFLFWTTYRAVIVGYQFIDFLLEEYIKKNVEKGSKAMVRALGNIAKGILWAFAFLVVLSILGVNVTGLVAGMGIGGAAIAFALQGILADLFSSFSIYFDKPFIEGDLIVVGGKWGTVEKIGIKSTRIRSLQGEEIVFSNKELTAAQVHNYRKMTQRRSEFKLGITYETPTQKMEKIPKMVKSIVDKEDLAEFGRIHFYNFGDFSLDYLLVYDIKSADYMTYMDINQKILLNIKKAFEKEEIEFAYPTKTIHLSGREENS